MTRTIGDSICDLCDEQDLVNLTDENIEVIMFWSGKYEPIEDEI